MKEEQFKRKEKSTQDTEDKPDSTLDQEITAGEWQRLTEFETYRRRSRQGKIIATYQAISNRLNQVVALYYQLVRNNPQKAIRLLIEIKKLRFLQSFLLDCLIWEEQGVLEDQKMPPELEGMI